jgi:hypothetical protein
VRDFRGRIFKRKAARPLGKFKTQTRQRDSSDNTGEGDRRVGLSSVALAARNVN